MCERVTVLSLSVSQSVANYAAEHLLNEAKKKVDFFKRLRLHT